jgi:ATP adenylyltransferase
MADFVNLDNAKRPSGVYDTVIDQIKKDGVCPFCPEHFTQYHKNPILKDGTYWLVTNNMYPYEGAKYHALFVHKRHITALTEIVPEAWTELKQIIDWYVAEQAIPGGALLLRFGSTAYTGASVSHLHANIISSDGENPDRKPILARLG